VKVSESLGHGVRGDCDCGSPEEVLGSDRLEELRRKWGRDPVAIGNMVVEAKSG